MKLIRPSYKILNQESGLQSIYKAIEYAGRLCYKSHDKITENSAEEFVKRMIDSGHHAMLEHGIIYLILIQKDYKKYLSNKYSIVKYWGDAKSIGFVTTNYRVLVENEWLDDLQYLCDLTQFHEKRIGVHFVLNKGISHEFVRNRGSYGNAFAQESSRYCNYSKNKFGENVSFIIPPQCTTFDECVIMDNEILHSMDNFAEGLFYEGLLDSEMRYFALLKQGWLAQEARDILPHDLKTELIITGMACDWEHFFKLRDDNAAHPQARQLAKPLHEEFIKLGYCDE